MARLGRLHMVVVEPDPWLVDFAQAQLPPEPVPDNLQMVAGDGRLFMQHSRGRLQARYLGSLLAAAQASFRQVLPLWEPELLLCSAPRSRAPWPRTWLPGNSAWLSKTGPRSAPCAPTRCPRAWTLGAGASSQKPWS